MKYVLMKLKINTTFYSSVKLKKALRRGFLNQVELIEVGFKNEENKDSWSFLLKKC